MELQNIGSFLIDQLAHIEQGFYNQKYPNLDYTHLVKTDTSANEYAETIVKKTLDIAGKPKFMNNKGNQIPRVDTSTGLITHTVKDVALGYTINWIEVARAAQANLPLDATKVYAVRRQMEEMLWDLVRFGDESEKIEGLFNNSAVDVETSAISIPELISAINAENGVQELVTFFQTYLDIIYLRTNGLYSPDLIVLKPQDYRALKTALIPFTGTSVLSSLRTTLEVEFTSDLLLDPEKGSLDSDRMIFLTRDMEVAKLHLPMPIKFLPKYSADGHRNVETDAWMRTGGVEVRIPDAMLYVDLPAPASAAIAEASEVTKAVNVAATTATAATAATAVKVAKAKATK